jgi:hypothetical protein
MEMEKSFGHRFLPRQHDFFNSLTGRSQQQILADPGIAKPTSLFTLVACPYTAPTGTQAHSHR